MSETQPTRSASAARSKLLHASVIASDLTPELLQHGRTVATERGVELDWREANAEALPFADDQLDTVIPCIRCHFAAHRQRSADVLIRVCQPEGPSGCSVGRPRVS